MPSDWIAYIGPFKFPYGQAGSRRVYGVACSLSRARYRVVVGSGQSTPPTLTLLHEEEDGSVWHQGLDEMPEVGSSGLKKSTRWFATLGRRTVQWLNQQPTKPTHVICYGAHTPLILRLLAWCRRNDVSLIIDVVEWYDPLQLPGGLFGPFNISAKVALRMLNPRSDGIIAITSYLQNYYYQRGCSVVRVPTILDVEKTEANLNGRIDQSQPLTLAYTGIPGKKDLIDNVIEGILQLDMTGERIRLVMAGPRIDEVLRLPALRSRGCSSLPESLVAMGPQPYEKALEVVRNADFMPLLRPPLRYAQAGFPTKVAECLAVGTPVVCNITSDLGDYVHDGIEGMVCRNHSVGSFVEVLERALAKTPEQQRKMRRAAREQAERSFDYRAYADSLGAFLSSVRSA